MSQEPCSLGMRLPLFSGVFGMRLSCVYLLRKASWLPGWPRGWHMIGDRYS